MAIYTIKNPEYLVINDGSRKYYGANQAWYKQEWQRLAGCGPTAATHLFWYMGRAFEKYHGLGSPEPLTKESIARLMAEVWQYVTPTTMGLNSPYVFASGAQAFAAARGCTLEAAVLYVDVLKCKRPTLDKVEEFISESLESNLPVAFLNLSNGSLTNLDAWHWVTLVGYNTANHSATMFDQGLQVQIDMKSWLRTSFFGGAFVSVK